MKRTGKRKSLLNMCGLLGAVSLLSYAAAVEVFDGNTWGRSGI